MVDAAGQEQDIVIFSTVRAGGAGNIGFLSDSRRLNVAITRAKFGCYLVGRKLKSDHCFIRSTCQPSQIRKNQNDWR